MLAKKVGWSFVELNKEVEQQNGLSVAEIIALYGQEGFRRMEQAALQQLLARNELMVLATGGGIVSEPLTFDQILSSFYTIWLKAEPEEHMARVRRQGDLRPMADDRSAMAELRNILLSREPLYSRATAVVDTAGLSVDAAAARLIDAVRPVLQNEAREFRPAQRGAVGRSRHARRSAAFPPPLRGRVRERGATLGLHHSRNALLLRDNQHHFLGDPSPLPLPRKGGGSRAERAATPCVPFSFRKGRRYEEPCTRQDLTMTSSDVTTSMFERIGGSGTIDLLVDRFYERMDTLPEAKIIRAMHADDLGLIRDVLKRYLTEWTGGPKLYSVEKGHPRLRQRHIGFAIGDAERDAWLLCMRGALDETVTDAAARQDLDKAISGLADWMRNRQ